jgi:DNA processing protein
MNNDRRYWLAFSLIPGIGPVRFGQLEAHFPSLSDAWSAPAGELKRAGLDDSAVRSITKNRPAIDLTPNSPEWRHWASAS